MPTAEVLSQGDEVVTGQITDTNAAWISEYLTTLGFTIMHHVGVGDRLPDLVRALQTISERSDLCVCTGGLGPTDDDLTANAVAEAFARPLQLDEEALTQLEAKYARFGREMARVNERQVWLPRGATRLDNDRGTAPGFAFTERDALFVCLPGVPREMEAMFEEGVLPLLRERFQLQPARLVTLRCVGVGESDLQQALGDLQAPGLTVSFRTKLPENHLKLRFDPEISTEALVEIVESTLDRVGRWVFTVEGSPVPLPGFDTGGGHHASAVGRLIAARGHTLSTAESCTGGRIAAACTAIPGASAWFTEGVITYANAAKVRLVGVSEALLREHGAVSEPVARQMASGVRQRAGTTWGIGVTGVAGPGGGSVDKPVGLVHVAIEGPGGCTHRQLRLPGDRDQVQQLSVAAALEMLRRRLLA
ncbi:MAG TPA: competence/damage-inducible protein A [Deltaproteobacteria bacterium]|nr:competence/damage-inducible protein A [Deltaproteobacteria bacterium]